MVSIIPYKAEHAAIFKKLNLGWLDQFQLTESHDLQVLNDPEGTICNRGGVILFAEADGEIVGSAALMVVTRDEFELAKMAVAPNMQGRGIGKLLLQAILDTAKAKNAKKITLFSNHQLKAALSLYRQFGFKSVAVTGSPFKTADVKMELEF